MYDKLLVLCRQQWGGPNRMRKLSDGWVKFGGKATGLEAKQVKVGPCCLERPEFVGLVLQGSKSNKQSEGRDSHGVVSSEERANEIKLISKLWNLL